MAFFEDLLNGLTQPPTARPSFGSMSVKPPAQSPVAPRAVEQPSGWDDMATFFAGMAEGGDGLLPALGAGARAVSAENKRKEAVNQTYDFLLRNGVSPEDAKATISNPDLLKMKLGQIFSPKTMAVNPGQVIIGADGKPVFDNRDMPKPTPEQSNYKYGQEDPQFNQWLEDQRKRAAGPTLDDKVAERERVADRLGIQGPQRTHFVATGDMPRETQPQEMKEYQTKDAMWAERMTRAEKALDDVAGIDEAGKPLEGKYNPAKASNKFWPDDMYGANLFNSKEWQRYQQAARESIAAILRKDTGAAVTQSEWDLYFPMLFPQPGDDPATVMQKKQSRMATAKALRASSGGAFDKMFPNYDAGGGAGAPTQGSGDSKPDPLGIR